MMRLLNDIGTLARGGQELLMQVAPARLEAEPEQRRYEALLRMTDAIARHRSLEEVFYELATWLRQATAFEFVTLNLHDPASNEMAVYFCEGVHLGTPVQSRRCDQPSAAGSGKIRRPWSYRISLAKTAIP